MWWNQQSPVERLTGWKTACLVCDGEFVSALCIFLVETLFVQKCWFKIQHQAVSSPEILPFPGFCTAVSLGFLPPACWGSSSLTSSRHGRLDHGFLTAGPFSSEMSSPQLPAWGHENHNLGGAVRKPRGREVENKQARVKLWKFLVKFLKNQLSLAKNFI